MPRDETLMSLFVRKRYMHTYIHVHNIVEFSLVLGVTSFCKGEGAL